LLTEGQLARLLDTRTRPDAGLPLYLLVALEELCLFGEYESLDLRIDNLPATLPDLFVQVLMRLEQDHTRDRTESILRLFAVSRSGLLESEILDLLGGGAGELSRIHWTQFYRSLEPYLRPVDEATGMGLIDFFHDQLRFAVYHRYLGMASPDAGSSEAYCRSHSQLADYFRGVVSDEGDPVVWRNDQPRGLAELPHHMVEAERKDELREMLFDFGWMRAKLDGVDVNSLIADYDYLSDNSNLQLVQGAIRLSAHVLARDKAQFAGQLLGRMQAFQKSEIRSMLKQARGWTGGLWVSPLTASLTPPGGLLRCILKGHTDVVDAVVVMPDGKRAISGSRDNTLRVWDIESGEELRTLEGHPRWVRVVAVSPDGKHAISGSKDKPFRVREIEKVADFQLNQALESRDTTLRVWEIESEEELLILEGHTYGVNAVIVTPDGKSAISRLWGNTLQVCDIENREEQPILEGFTDGVNAFAVTPDGKYAISGFNSDPWNNDILVWDIESGEELPTLEGHTDRVTAVTITPDGKRAISGSMDGTLKIWDVENGKELLTLKGHTDSVSALAVTPDGKRAISGSWDGTLKIWDVEDGNELLTLKGHIDTVSAVAVTPDGKHAISGSSDKTLKVWDIGSGEELQILEGHTDRITAVTITPDGKRAISGSWDGTLKIWDVENGKELLTLVGHFAAIHTVTVTPDGKHAISGSIAGTLKIWDVESGKELLTLKGHTDLVTAVAATPDGKHAISGSWDSTLRVWDIESGEELLIFEGHTDKIFAVTITPDGKHAISGSRDNTLRVWDIESGEELRTLKGHADSVSAVAVTPDGQYAISGSLDNTLRVWDIKSGKFLASFSVDGSLHACAISPDGRTIVACDASGRVHFLRLENIIQGASIATAWHLPDQLPAFLCPICRTWSEIPASAISTEIPCPHCGKPIRLNPFTINADRQVAKAWRGVKE
jgi:WD40 repeat protein